VRTRLALAAAILVLSTVGCSGDDNRADRIPSATVGTEPPTTTTTNPYAIPVAIDAAYVNRVLAGLDAVVGDAIRIVVTARFINRDASDRLKAVYGTDAQLDFTLDLLSQDVARGLSGYRSPPGNKVTNVTELLSSSSSCIYTKVSRDYSRVGVGTVPTDDVQWIALRPLDRSRDAFNYNYVGWAYIYEGFQDS